MNVTKIKEFRDTYKGTKNIDIFLDNSLVLYMGLPGHIVIWDDANETIVYIRTNQSQVLQAGAPFEILITGYDHIQHMAVRGSVDDVEKYLTKINYGKKADLVKYLSSLDVNKSSITAATGDERLNRQKAAMIGELPSDESDDDD